MAGKDGWMTALCVAAPSFVSGSTPNMEDASSLSGAQGGPLAPSEPAQLHGEQHWLPPAVAPSEPLPNVGRQIWRLATAYFE
ncbi:hypothetical protein Emed_005555 [Eimeria media]